MNLATSADGTAIAFDRFGAGPPVVVVGGAICDRARTRPLAERMSQRFTVFNYDRRGRGDSGDTGPYAVDWELADLAAIIEQTGGIASVYGHSSGAALVLRASAAGVPISKAVLHDPLFTPDTDDAKRVSQAYAKSLTSLLEANRNSDAPALFMELVGTPPTVVQQLRTQPWWSPATVLAPTLAYDSAVMDHRGGSSIPVDVLSAATIPTMVVCGGANAGWMVGTNQQLAAALPNGSYRELIGQHHEVDPDIWYRSSKSSSVTPTAAVIAATTRWRAGRVGRPGDRRRLRAVDRHRLLDRPSRRTCPECHGTTVRTP